MNNQIIKRAAIFLGLASVCCLSPVDAQDTAQTTREQANEEANKEIARGFYEDLWFSNNTGNYVQ